MSQIIKDFLKRSRQKKLNIKCVGDAMIDEYYEVDVNRISPEFPMPIMLSPHEKPVRRPGGVANVAYQLRHFNTSPCLVCFMDKKLRKVLSKHKIDYDSISTETMLDEVNGFVPVKKRFLDHGVQVSRWDVEDTAYGLHYRVKKFWEMQKRISEEMRKRQPDVVILSDYNKGFFQALDYNEQVNWIEPFSGRITIVDPKTGPIDKWKGCTIFKPNSKEAAELSGKGFWREQAKFFQNKLGCETVVITHGGEKVCGVSGSEFFNYMAPKKVEVESVVGAGDCFCAFFAMAVGLGFSAIESAEIAWNAGAIYVQDKMNRPITPAEIIGSGIVSPEDLVSRDFKLVFTNGCFDLLHSGHLSTLRFAKSHGDKLVVAVNSDKSVKSLKGESRPIKPLEERMAVLAALDMVDFVVSFEESDPYKLIDIIRPDVLVKGGEYEEKDIIGANLVKEVLRAPMMSDLSTTKFLTCPGN
jgi:D-beta-D-heptose 7-phosphate kinase/D-beta-D-heptose 1-phosphate adenosyltransferase